MYCLPVIIVTSPLVVVDGGDPPPPNYQCPPLHRLEYQSVSLFSEPRSWSKLKSEDKLLNLKITSQVMRNIQFSCLRIIRETQTHHLERVVMIGGGREERKGHNGINIFIIMLGCWGANWGHQTLYYTTTTYYSAVFG